MGRRIEKNVDGVITRYLYSNEGLIAEYDINNNLKKSYGWLPNGIWGTDPLYMTENNQTYFYHNDALGTPQKMTDASGTVVWSATYTSFGEATIDASSTITSNLRFAGQYFDQETGINYNLFRVYDPKTGTYISKDPISFAAGDVNLYRYVGNSPLNDTDPYGLFWPIDCYKCWRDKSKIDKATDKCRDELLNNKSDNLEDELEADIKFMEKYNGTDYGSAIWNCAQEKTGDKKIWKKAAANCFKCGFLQGPKTPTIRR